MIVPQHDAPRIRRPAEQGEIILLSQGVASGPLESGSIAYQQRLDAALIAEVGDLLAVSAPQRIGFPHARRCSQVPHRAILHRNAEDLAARGNQDALAGGREPCRGDVLAGVLPLRARLQGGRREVNGDRLDQAGDHVE